MTDRDGMICTNCHRPTGVDPDWATLSRDLSHRWKKRRDAATRAITALCENWRCSDCLDELDRDGDG